MLDNIYCLCYYENYDRVIFYIGRTIDMSRRIYEHRLATKNYKKGDEWCYEFASTLEQCGIKWDMELIMQCGPDTEFYEEFFRAKYKNEGHPIQNMKIGDLEVWQGRTYSTPSGYRAAKLRAQEAAKTHIIRIKKETDPEKTLYVGEKPNERFMSPWMKDRLKK